MLNHPVEEIFDPDEFRLRLAKMSDRELERMGRAAEYMSSPRAYPPGQPPRQEFIRQLELCRAEWRRRKG